MSSTNESSSAEITSSNDVSKNNGENPGDSITSADKFEERINADKMLMAKLQQMAAAIVRCSNALPKFGDGYELYASYPDFAKFMEQQRLRIVLAMRKMLNHMGCRLKITTFTLEDMERIIAANDILVERVGISLEEQQRLITQELIVKSKVNTGAEAVPGTSALVKNFKPKDGGRYATLFNKNVESVSIRPISCAWDSNSVFSKPQKAFQNAIVNADSPFIPKLVIKHNAIETMTIRRSRIIDENPSNGDDENWHENEQNSACGEKNYSEHPYRNELEHFVVPKAHLSVPESVEPPMNVNDTPRIFVDNEAKLRDLVATLNGVSEFAVDLEHHDYRSFLGLTCLLQISTRTADYIVDPFPIWNFMHLLNEPFTNPNIVKVFHAADSDVIWLQRDFGIYVVGLFDTALTMHYLGFRHLGLKHMLKDFCDVILDKKLQKADWRIRPLPESFIAYAQLDSHFLLYCYDVLRQKLAQLNGSSTGEKKDISLKNIKNVFMLSKRIAGRVFEQPRFDAQGYRELFSVDRPLNNRQLYALKQLWRWRDGIAREHDESLHYVLPPHMMLQIAEALPRDAAGILECCAPVPPLVRHDLTTLLEFINNARELPLKKMTHSASNLSIEDDVNSASNFDPALETNRITKTKAKLEYRLDCTNFKADEEISSAQARVDSLRDGTNFPVEKDAADVPFMLNIRDESARMMLDQMRSMGNKKNGAANQVYVVDERTEEERKSAEARLRRAHAKLLEWHMPYEAYLATKHHLIDENTTTTADNDDNCNASANEDTPSAKRSKLIKKTTFTTTETTTTEQTKTTVMTKTLRRTVKDEVIEIDEDV